MMFSNMCKCIVLVLVFEACASNRNTKEYIIDTKYNQAIGGYKKGTLFEIDRKYWYSDYIADSLAVEIGLTPSVDRTTSKIYMVNVLTVDNSRYMTSKGIKIGDTAQKVEDTYGKPVSHYFSPGYLPGGYLVEFPGLLYKNMLFVIDTSNYKVIGFMIGDFSHSW